MFGEVVGVSLLGEVRAVLIRARDDAVPAAKALVGIDGDDAVLTLVRGLGRAGVHTGGLFALVAPDRIGGHVDVGAVVGLEGDQSRPGHAQRQEMLDPTRRYACVAPCAFCEVDHHSPSHDRPLPSVPPRSFSIAIRHPLDPSRLPVCVSLLDLAQAAAKQAVTISRYCVVISPYRKPGTSHLQGPEMPGLHDFRDFFAAMRRPHFLEQSVSPRAAFCSRFVDQVIIHDRCDSSLSQPCANGI